MVKVRPFKGFLANQENVGKVISPADKVAMAAKIMKRCDSDENGFIDKGEFQSYYESVAADSFRCVKLWWGSLWS